MFVFKLDCYSIKNKTPSNIILTECKTNTVKEFENLQWIQIHLSKRFLGFYHSFWRSFQRLFHVHCETSDPNIRGNPFWNIKKYKIFKRLLPAIRDVPDTLFLPDSGYTRISNSTGFRITDSTGYQIIPDNARYCLPGKVHVIDSLI